MIKKLLFAFSAVALAVVSAAGSYRVSIFNKTSIGGSQLNPGDYKVEVKENKAIFLQGKKSFEAPVEVQTSQEKFGATSVKYVNGAIQEIRLGGTNTKLVFQAN